ncbi:MAG: hypothetical protein ACLVHS_03100 [Blautia wexlerae]
MPEISTKAKYDIEYAKINLNVFLLMSKRKNTKKSKPLRLLPENP